MRITGNENGKKLADEIVSTKSIEALATIPTLSDTIFFNALGVEVSIKEADFDSGKFQVSMDLGKIAEIPTITVGIDSGNLVKDLFVNSGKSAENRAGVQEFIKAGVLNAIVNSFSTSTFENHLQILDEKLKSKTIEIQQANIAEGVLSKFEEAPNLVTSQDELVVDEVEILKEIGDLKAQGFEEHSLIENEEVHKESRGQTGSIVADDYVSDEDDEDVPANYKPLGDGTSEYLKAKDEKEDDDDGVMESIAKLNV